MKKIISLMAFLLLISFVQTVYAASNVTIWNEQTGRYQTLGRVKIDPNQNTVSSTVTMDLVTKTSSQDLSAAALSYTTNFAAETRIKNINLNSTVAITETITVTLDSVTGANYDTILSADDLITEQNFTYSPSELILREGDELEITCTDNGGIGTIYVEVIGETIL